MPLNPRTIAAMYKAAGLSQPGAAGVRYYLGKGAAGEGLLRQNLSRDRRSSTYTGAAAPAAPVAPTDPTQAFVDTIKDELPKSSTTITPFDQSGFYNEADVKALAGQEYDPYYARLRALREAADAQEGRRRGIEEAQGDQYLAETVNAAGGLRSSAYQRDLGNVALLRSTQGAQRKSALERSLEEEENQKRADKSGFVTNRRNEAYQRYLQSIGAATS